MHMSSLTSDLALSYISWYDLFHIQAALTNVSILSGLHTFAMIGEATQVVYHAQEWLCRNDIFVNA